MACNRYCVLEKKRADYGPLSNKQTKETEKVYKSLFSWVSVERLMIIIIIIIIIITLIFYIVPFQQSLLMALYTADVQVKTKPHKLKNKAIH